MIKKIKALLQEAELYHFQGLLHEAMGKYINATELIQSNEQLKSRQKDLIENLKIGATLNDVQYCSTIAILNGTGVVSDIKEIKTRPRRGDYCVDIEVVI